MIFDVLVGCRSGILFVDHHINVFQCVHLEESASHPPPSPRGSVQSAQNDPLTLHQLHDGGLGHQSDLLEN